MFIQTSNRQYRQKRSAFCFIASIFMAISIIFTQSLAVTSYAASAVSVEECIQLAYFLNKNETFSGSLNNEDPSPTNTADGSTAMYCYSGDKPADGDSFVFKNVFTWENITSWQQAYDEGKISSKCKNATKYGQLSSKLVKVFGSQGTFQAAVNKLTSVSWHTVEFGYSIDMSSDTGNRIRNVVQGFSSTMAQGAINDNFSQTFSDTDFDPNVGIAKEFMGTINNVANTVFSVLSNLMMILFLAQTAADVLYLVVEPIRPFLTKGGEGSSLGGNSAGGSGVLSKFRLPVCSSSAIEAANGGSSGGLGGGNAGGGTGNMFIKYITSRAPVLILCAIYLILVTMGYWQSLISWLAGFVITALDWLMSLGG